MQTRILHYWESLRTSFWLIPSLLVIVAVVLSFDAVSIDRIFDFGSQRFFGLFFSVSHEGARSVLTTIAGSMMTVAGVTFSITIVVLNLASSQFGPRLLRNFMQDKATQFVLGTFLATFLYCLLVLRSVGTGPDNSFVPNLAITVSIVLALFNIGVLIFFIHHVATSIQADEVVAQISGELENNIDRLFPDRHEQQAVELRKTAPSAEDDDPSYHYGHEVVATCDGYLQAIDVKKLLQLFQNHNLTGLVPIRPGQFVVKGGVLARVKSKDIFDVGLEDDIVDAFILGDQRTAEQDAEYSIRQLVEVAVRALSPGINDPFTAITCIDQLCSSLCFLARRAFPLAAHLDDQGRKVLELKPFTFSGMVSASYDQIRQYGGTSIEVIIRLLASLTLIAEQSRTIEQRDALYDQAKMLFDAGRAEDFQEGDKKDILCRYQDFLQKLNSFGDPERSYEVPDAV